MSKSGLLITLEKIKGKIDDNLYIELIEELLHIIDDGIEAVCPVCYGYGEVEEWWGHPEEGPPHVEVHNCPMCHGKGMVSVREMLIKMREVLLCNTVSSSDDTEDDIEF